MSSGGNLQSMYIRALSHQIHFPLLCIFSADSPRSPSHSKYSKQIRGTYYLYPWRIYSSPKPRRDLQGQRRYLCKDSQPVEIEQKPGKNRGAEKERVNACHIEWENICVHFRMNRVQKRIWKSFFYEVFSPFPQVVSERKCLTFTKWSDILY